MRSTEIMLRGIAWHVAHRGTQEIVFLDGKPFESFTVSDQREIMRLLDRALMSAGERMGLTAHEEYKQEQLSDQARGN